MTMVSESIEHGALSIHEVWGTTHSGDRIQMVASSPPESSDSVPAGAEADIDAATTDARAPLRILTGGASWSVIAP